MSTSLSALVIDDQESWRITLGDLLEQKGFAVSAVGSYEAARTLIESRVQQETPFDLATVDLLLGDAELYADRGFALLERLLALGTAVVVVTAFPEPPLVDAMFKTYGFLGLVGKNSVSADLGTVIKEVLATRRRRPPPPTYNVAAVRELLQEAFNAQDLLALCHDRPDFRPVTRRVGANASLEDIAAALLAHCETRLLFPELMEAIRECNPRRYAQHAVRVTRPPLSDSDRERLVRLLREASGRNNP